MVDHVVILDGTLSSLREGTDSHAGTVFRLLSEAGRTPRRTLYYEEGLQWQGWRRAGDLLQGRGIEGQIARAYGHLASHYRPGDRIFLFGYSRGAYAVRSVAGVIDRLGLLRQSEATERNVRLALRHYSRDPDSAAARSFAEKTCHAKVLIQMIGVWDTVKALGLRLPLLWMLTEKNHRFHDTELGHSVAHGFQALALNETRAVFHPVLWTSQKGETRLEQVWFQGSHGDVGGQIGRNQQVRPLANIPLVWMLDRAESVGLVLPIGWRSRFPCDPHLAPSSTWRGYNKLFLLRHRRKILQDPSERLHESVPLKTRRLNETRSDGQSLPLGPKPQSRQ